jgi:hypothetical protein
MSYLNDTLTRLVAMEEEAVSGSDAADYAVHWQDGFPYWTNRITDYSPGEVLADQSQRIYTVDIFYFHGYITEDAPGKVEEGILSVLPTIQTFFEEHPGLESALFPTALRYLDPQQTRLLASPVVADMGAGTAGTKVLGTQIRLQIMFNVNINPK